ncbi:NAD-dependent epimerase/dehydratase family protein [Microtetraspora sp. NBRC 16547]|uniref:NAD-dependent epimerase/dehydratase family protein n=1 Tax=Microtetraspora sp. NBRC 16547 TaxID=3030993 RepID=UPI0024A1C170|nr:NAD-dependent epimerase/dehydratase family protein [Microtetraspora sp. NBRC 16547]GLW98170.1 3-beta hydroxysteroid dehydrogenase [Microtetraspora sp. NBRC 16547]
MATVFVTGGSGFIGGRLISRLVSEGHSVKALARSDLAARKVTTLGARPVRGDLDDLGSAAEGCDWAFHAAAQTPGTADRQAFIRANVEGTRNVLEATRKAGVSRFIHVGTEAALRAGDPLINVDETAPLRPDSRSPYAATKAMAEQLVRDAGGIVIRPCLVWGPGDTTALPQFMAAVRSGKFAWIDHGSRLTETTHVDNVVEGLVRGAEKGRSGEAYFVTDGSPLVFREFLTDLLATQNLTPPARSIPYGVASRITSVLERVWLRGTPPLDYMSLWLTGLECTIDITKARAELGYAPIRTQAEGLAELRTPIA